MIRLRGIKAIEPGFHRPAYQLPRAPVINAAVALRLSHTAETEQRKYQIRTLRLHISCSPCEMTEVLVFVMYLAVIRLPPLPKQRLPPRLLEIRACSSFHSLSLNERFPYKNASARPSNEMANTLLIMD